jgi:hypothetical protein
MLTVNYIKDLPIGEHIINDVRFYKSSRGTLAFKEPLFEQKKIYCPGEKFINRFEEIHKMKEEVQ